VHCTRNAIELERLSYAYADKTQALDEVSVLIHHEERVALLGPNGAGKSTLIGHLNGIVPAQSGTVLIEDEPLLPGNLVAVRRKVGIVFQDPDNMLFMTSVRDDVAFGPQNAGLSAAEVDARVQAALSAVELQEVAEKPGAHLSLGQKKRAALAAVLAQEPAILILDEPTSNLDPRTRRAMMQLVASLDITLLLATHDLDCAWELCERSLIIDEGRLVADGLTRELLRDKALMERHGLEVPPSAR
jgi:cobalt/nickel transport system ATP-binding protein